MQTMIILLNQLERVLQFGCGPGRPLSQKSLARIQRLGKGTTCSRKTKDGRTVYYRTDKGKRLQSEGKKRRAALRAKNKRYKEKIAKRKAEGKWIGRTRKVKAEKTKKAVEKLKPKKVKAKKASPKIALPKKTKKIKAKKTKEKALKPKKIKEKKSIDEKIKELEKLKQEILDLQKGKETREEKPKEIRKSKKEKAYIKQMDKGIEKAWSDFNKKYPYLAGSMPIPDLYDALKKEGKVKNLKDLQDRLLELDKERKLMLELMNTPMDEPKERRKMGIPISDGDKTGLLFYVVK